MTKEPVKYKFFRLPDGNVVIPHDVIGYGNSFEIDGIILDPKSNNDLIVPDVKTMRRVSCNKIVVSYSNGVETISVTEYETRLAKLRVHRKQIGVVGEYDCPKYEWDDPQAMFDEHILVRTFQPVSDYVVIFGTYLDFEIIDIPKSDNPHIIPLWKTEKDLTNMFYLNKTGLVEITLANMHAKYPEIKYQLFPYDLSVRIGDHFYNEMVCSSTIYRGTYEQCVTVAAEIVDTIQKAFIIESKKDLPVANNGTILGRLKNIQATAGAISTKEKSRDQYNSLKKTIAETIDLMEKSIVYGCE